MRVLLVTDQYCAEGGAEAIVAGLARGLDERGHDVRLLVARRTVDAPNLPERIGCDVVAWSGEGQAPDPAASSLAAALGEAFLPDVVHFHNIFDAGVVTALRDRWPSIWTVHDHRAHCPNGDRRYPRGGGLCWLPMGGACLVKSLTHGCVAGPRLETVRQLHLREAVFSALESADQIVAPSRCVGRLLEINGVASDRIAYVAPFTPYADMPVPPPYPNGGNLLFAARLVPQKGVADVLWLAQALTPACGARLIIAGDGPLRDEVEAAVIRTKTIDYRGKLDPDRLSQAYREAAVVVVAPRWLDPSPLVGIEALAHARPVVSYRTGGMAELIEDGYNGVTVGSGDRPALAAAVRSLLNEPARAAEMGQRGWTRVRERNRPRHALAATERVYNEALRIRGRSATHLPCAVELFNAAKDEGRWRLALAVRLAVFVREQDVPLEAEVDAHDRGDPTCRHVSAMQGNRAVAAGRICEEQPGIGRIGRMAVLPAYRGAGVGLQILDALLSEARKRGLAEVVLDSQIHALGFYARQGFAPEGPVFNDCGIPHQRMRLVLR